MYLGRFCHFKTKLNILAHKIHVERIVIFSPKNVRARSLPQKGISGWCPYGMPKQIQIHPGLLSFKKNNVKVNYFDWNFTHLPIAKHSDIAKTWTAQSIFDKTFGIIAVPNLPLRGHSQIKWTQNAYFWPFRQFLG